MNQMEEKLDSFDKRINKTEKTVQSVEKSVEFISTQYDAIIEDGEADRAKVKSVESEVSDVKQENKELRKAILEMKKLNCEMKEDLIDMKSRSMRDNLLFTDLSEHENEDTEQVLKNFLSDKMSITDVSFERVHRVGRVYNRPSGQAVRPRSIVAKFSFFKDRERVRKSANRLKGTHYGIREQFPEEIEQRRKPLYPILRKARQEKKKAVLVKDRLFVEGKEVSAGSNPGNNSVTGKYMPGSSKD